MSSSGSSPYTLISKQIALYAGMPIFILGMAGEISNIVVFLSLRTFRQSACALFLTVMSFVNLGQLLTALLSRIMITGFGVDWTETSLFYCKFRMFCLQFCALSSYTCMCLATIDQYMATSFRVYSQKYFTVKKARIACATFFVIWCVQGIPAVIAFSLTLNTRTGGVGCGITIPTYQSYYSYVYLLTLTGALPIIIDVTFASLAYWNVRSIPYRSVPLVRRELDKQLSSMVLVQVVYRTIVVVPYVTILFVIYTVDLNTLPISMVQFNFMNFVTGMIYYLQFASPFYIYMCVSKRFRQQFVHVFSSICFKQGKQGAACVNQVTPDDPPPSQ